MKTPLRLESSFVTRLVLEANETYNPEVGPGGITNTSLNLTNQGEVLSGPWVLGLEVAVGDSDDGSSVAPYRIHGQIVGVFEIDPTSEDPAEVATVVGVNGASMLYSALREYLLLLSSRGPWGSFQLPTWNFRSGRFTKVSEQKPDEASAGKRSTEVAATAGSAPRSREKPKRPRTR
jgi:hypothetical protein